MRQEKILTALAASLIIGILAGRYLLPSGHENDTDTVTKEIIYWVAPMDPNYRSDEPGKSPMGMDLIPVYAGDKIEGEESVVTIAPHVVQNMGVKSEPVMMGTLSSSIETVGFVAINEELTSHIHVRSSGWIEDLRIKSEGERVEEGDLLFRFYSPDIANAKSELIRAINSGNRALIDASKSRLRSLNVPQTQIENIITSGQADELVNVYAPQNGIIAALNVAEGMHIQPGTTVMSLADLSRLWVNAEVFEDEVAWLKDGGHASVHVPFMPERSWHGMVDFVYPTINERTRTVRARLVFDNADLALKPGMYAEVSIDVAPIQHALTISRSALIQTGSSNRVILDMGAGMFRPVEVTTGAESGPHIQVLSGLKAGDRVVTSGQFLIDSEASLSGSFLRMQPNEAKDMAESETQHSGESHDTIGDQQ